MISFGLLLLLGVSGNQFDQKASSAVETESIGLIDARSGILPEASSELPLPLFSRWSRLPDGPCSLFQQHESSTSAVIRTWFLFSRVHFLDYRQGLAEKKGIFLIFTAPEGDHSMA